MKGVLYVLVVLLVRLCAPAARLSLVDWNSYNYREPLGPGTYAFGYDIDDPASNNVQFRNEERHPNGTVTGSYGYVDPKGKVRVVRYIADHRGYRATEEEGLKLSMLKPVGYPDTPSFVPATPYEYRTRPIDRFPYYQGYPPYRYYVPNNL